MRPAGCQESKWSPVSEEVQYIFFPHQKFLLYNGWNTSILFFENLRNGGYITKEMEFHMYAYFHQLLLLSYFQ